MSKPIAVEARIVVVTATDQFAVECPPMLMDLLNIARTDADVSFTVTMHARKLFDPAASPTNIARIENEGGKVKITPAATFWRKVGDVVTVAGSSVGGYNVSHVVTKVYPSGSFVTDINFVSETNNNGTVRLDIPAAQRPAWQLGATTTVANSAPQALNGVPFVCQDSPNPDGPTPSKIYLTFSEAGTYVLTLRGRGYVA